jgi:plastocyanin
MKLVKILVLAVAVALFASIASANTAQVLIKDFKFQPDQITIQKGDTITWTHPGPASHTVKFADSESPILKNGSTYSKTFSQTGTFPYSCGIHPYMHGDVTVK